MSPPIDAVSNLGSPPSSAATHGSNKLGKNEFLKLLMAQLSQQDPTNPADSTAFVAQLAQFANVEQLQAMNGQLEAILVAQAANNQTTTATLVGKDVTYRSDLVALDASGATIRGDLSAAAESVTAVIKDSTGRTVRTVQLPAQPKGALSFQWDGRDDQGVLLPNGEYKVTLTAADVNGKNVPVESMGRGHVGGISFAKGYPELVVGGARVKLSDVVQIDEPTPQRKGSNP